MRAYVEERKEMEKTRIVKKKIKMTVGLKRRGRNGVSGRWIKKEESE